MKALTLILILIAIIVYSFSVTELSVVEYRSTPKSIKQSEEKVSNAVLVYPKYSYEWIMMVEGVKKFEGFYSRPYICPAGVKTIGYGHTGKEVNRSYISEYEATELLQQELEVCRDIVLSSVKVPLTEAQLAALTSFTFNLGRGSLYKLVSGKGRLNSGNYESIENILPLYRKADGKILRGLVKRRAWELDLWKANDNLIAQN